MLVQMNEQLGQTIIERKLLMPSCGHRKPGMILLYVSVIAIRLRKERTSNLSCKGRPETCGVARADLRHVELQGLT